jgi:S-adenosylmethionine:tRNA ribosyltransferase-isomerase
MLHPGNIHGCIGDIRYGTQRLRSQDEALQERVVMRTEDLDFDLPPELIAQAPAPDRSASRLLHYRRTDRSIAHRKFADLPSILNPGDLLVFNDAQVIPARFTLQKPTGGLVEGLHLSQQPGGAWRVLLKNVGPDPVGRVLTFADVPEVELAITSQYEEGEFSVQVNPPVPALDLLQRVGRMPLPPYIKRDKHHDARDEFDRGRYQTVYAKEPGSVAAPTAGLHFTRELLTRLEARGIERTFVTLHVGMGTFKPVTSETLEHHRMHAEAYSIPSAAAAAINRANRDDRRIIAVGTTAARVLESQDEGDVTPKHGETSIFIYPPYQWKHVQAVITNFHLPRSTLIALVAAFVGLEEQRRIYAMAIEEKYRFFSYGDAMLLE